MDNDISAFSKGRMLYQCITRCTRRDNRSQMTQKTYNWHKREFLKVHNTKYLSVKCAVLMHLSFTCITRMIDFGVVYLSTCFQHQMWWVMGHVSSVMGHISDGSMGHGSIPMTHCLLRCMEFVTTTVRRKWCFRNGFVCVCLSVCKLSQNNFEWIFDDTFGEGGAWLVKSNNR